MILLMPFAFSLFLVMSSIVKKAMLLSVQLLAQIKISQLLAQIKISHLTLNLLLFLSLLATNFVFNENVSKILATAPEN